MKILKNILLIVAFTSLYSCSGGKDSTQPIDVFEVDTSSVITPYKVWKEYHCRINDVKNISSIDRFITKDARYLFGRKGGFWIQKFTLDGDSVWDTILKNGYNAFLPVLLSNGNIAIGEALGESTDTPSLPVIISAKDGSAKVINPKTSPFYIYSIYSYSNFFICSPNYSYYPKATTDIQVDNDGNIISEMHFSSVPEGMSYYSDFSKYERKEITFFVDYTEYISVTGGSIRRANLKSGNIWYTCEGFTDINKNDVTITVKDNYVFVKYNSSGKEIIKKFSYSTGKLVNDVDYPEGDGKDMPNG